MATANPSVVATPMASPGYGKRSAPGQSPRRKDDFAHLPPREASIAAYIDRLPDGAAIDAKTLAKDSPAYGQMAVRSALNALSAAGHLRRVRELIGEGRTQWVFRTYFSRRARDDAWWARFLAGDVEPEVHRDERPARSDAYDALAALGGADERMTLSAAECAELEELAGAWVARGAARAQIVRALTSGLPPVVHAPAALARKRLTDKLPPEPVHRNEIPRRIMECTACGVPGRPEALPGGLCGPCRGVAAPRTARSNALGSPRPRGTPACGGPWI